MQHRISRRTLITAAALIAPAALLPNLPPDPAAPLFKRDAARGARAGDGTTVTAASSTVRSYGPNGTHWPADTPWFDASFGRVIDVACTWDAIGKAIGSVTDAQIASGVHIRVAPGTLPGFGSSSGSKPALQGVGRGTATKNILVSPKNGWGTVTIADDVRIRSVKGVTFARINGRSILLTDSSGTNWAQSKVTVNFRMTASSGIVRDCNAYEVVMPDAKVDISDPFGYAAGSNSMITDSVWEGCYCAPVFRPAGASDHIDTLQMYGNGAYRGLTIRDSLLFGSLNSALQLGGPKPEDPELGTPFLTLDHSILTAQVIAMQARYPLPNGAYAPTLGQAINGSGESNQLFAKDSYVFGSMYTTKWGRVENSFTAYNKAPANNPAVSGGWVYDPAMATVNASWFDTRSPKPTDDYLASIWS
ncbi:hypothetical protein [Agromyces sp. NPDC055661]|jgi:hypothetical protein